MLKIRRTTVLFTLILAGALAGCSGPTEPEQTFDTALARWRATGLVNYQFESTVSCFCGPEYSAPMTVTVRNGQVTSVVDRASGAVKPLNYRQPIDSLFGTVATEIRVRPERLRVTYDPALGFPRTLTYGTPENDAGGSISVESVRALP